MPPKIEMMWPTRADAQLSRQIHRVLHDVAELGGAIGYLTPPTSAETDTWLEQTLAAVRSSNAALVVGLLEGTVQATGLWRRSSERVFTHCADLEKVMAHPHSRGLGLGRLVLTALIDDARTAGIETLDLRVRGNNHGAIELYEQLGFTEWGRRPNVVEIGDERYDEVRMALRLGHAPNVILRGSPSDGPGWSPRRAPTPAGRPRSGRSARRPGRRRT
jgi:ribosomal protein S18 acetylase RimI-like enzyme